MQWNPEHLEAQIATLTAAKAAGRLDVVMLGRPVVYRSTKELDEALVYFQRKLDLCRGRRRGQNQGR